MRLRCRGVFVDVPGEWREEREWSFASGAFVEFVSEDEPGSTGSPWFTDTPRVIGLGFASDDFPADTTWPDPAGSWWMDESHTLTDGSCFASTLRAPTNTVRTSTSL